MGNWISKDNPTTCPTSRADDERPGELPSPEPVVESTDKAIVAAIDVGTTYSGFAYSDRKQFNLEDSTSVKLNKWTGSHVQNQYDKAPSVVLFDPEGKFHSFGYKAESEYMRIVKAGDHKQWYCFRRFKMQLYNEKVTRMFS